MHDIRDSVSLEEASDDISQHVIRVIRNHKKEIKHMITCDTCEVMDFESKLDNDPLPIDEMESFNRRPKRATLNIQSLKEPSLNTKMRSNSVGWIRNRAKRKKSVKK